MSRGPETMSEFDSVRPTTIICGPMCFKVAKTRACARPKIMQRYFSCFVSSVILFPQHVGSFSTGRWEKDRNEKSLDSENKFGTSERMILRNSAYRRMKFSLKKNPSSPL